MSDREPLHALCAEWTRLSESEGAAILISNWPAVAECQERKKALQSRLTLEAQRFNAHIEDAETGPLIKKLLDLELRNQAWMARQSQKMSEKRQAIARSSRDLRRVRSAYSSRPDSLWNSFS